MFFGQHCVYCVPFDFKVFAFNAMPMMQMSMDILILLSWLQVDLGDPGLPRFLCPSQSQLDENAKVVLEHIGQQGSRNFMLVFDETIYYPAWSLMLPECIVV